MKEEIPESFWEALVEIKDKDIENARELFQTAMKLAKKYKDERDKRQTEHDRALKAWVEAVSGRTDALLERDEAREELKEVERENEQLLASNKTYERDWPILVNERNKYKIGHDRYEKLRRLSPMQFHELYDRNIKTGKPFDTLVDEL